jgi:predicted O-linked N-acetylglucosamine transferase (SPINDLY family)
LNEYWLQAAELEELVCTTPEEYEELAVTLAVDEKRYMDLRTKLEANRDSLPLFDTKRWVANAEEGFARMCQRYEQGLPPDHIDVPDMLGRPTVPE